MPKFESKPFKKVASGKGVVDFGPLGCLETDDKDTIELLKTLGDVEEVKPEKGKK